MGKTSRRAATAISSAGLGDQRLWNATLAERRQAEISDEAPATRALPRTSAWRSLYPQLSVLNTRALRQIVILRGQTGITSTTLPRSGSRVRIPSPAPEFFKWQSLTKARCVSGLFVFLSWPSGRK